MFSVTVIETFDNESFNSSGKEFSVLGKESYDNPMSVISERRCNYEQYGGFRYSISHAVLLVIGYRSQSRDPG